jgi:hypothetical protein
MGRLKPTWAVAQIMRYLPEQGIHQVWPLVVP